MKKRKRWFLIAAALGGIAVLLRPWRFGPRPAASAAPAFHLSDTAGRVISLSDFKGQIVLLNFWATWCDSCRQEMPALGSVYQRHRGKSFALLAVSVDQEGRKAVLSYLAQHPLPYPVLLSDTETSQAYHVFGLPANFLIDARGRIARVYQGPVDEQTVENDILELQAAPGQRKS